MKKDVEFSPEMKKLTKKRSMGFAKELVNDWERRMTAYNSEIQEKLLNWIIPYIQMLSLAYYANSQFMPQAILESELNKRFEKESIEASFWFRKLKEIQKEVARDNPEYAKSVKELEKLKNEAYKEANKT